MTKLSSRSRHATGLAMSAASVPPSPIAAACLHVSSDIIGSQLINAPPFGEVRF